MLCLGCDAHNIKALSCGPEHTYISLWTLDGSLSDLRAGLIAVHFVLRKGILFVSNTRLLKFIDGLTVVCVLRSVLKGAYTIKFLTSRIWFKYSTQIPFLPPIPFSQSRSDGDTDNVSAPSPLILNFYLVRVAQFVIVPSSPYPNRCFGYIPSTMF